MTITDDEILELEHLLELETTAQRCKDSLYEFLLEFWDVIASNELTINWHLKALCDEIQPLVLKALRLEKKTGDLIINIAPGTTKSTIISQMLPSWCWCVVPESIIISSTGTAQLTTKNSMKSRDIITSSRYKELFPEVVMRKDASAKTFYQNTKNGVRYSFTTKGDPIGNHAHLIIQDDPESQSEAKSKVMMERSYEGMKALSTRMIDKESTLRILLMQRLSPIDSTSEALRTFYNPIHICLPAIDSDLVKPSKFREKYVDGLLDPFRLSRKTLETEKKKLNTSNENGTSEEDFPAQFLQDPRMSEGRVYDLKYYDDYLNNEGVISLAFVDPADKGTDHCAVLFLKIIGSKIYCDDAIYTQDSSEETSSLIAKKTLYHNCSRVVVESNGLGATYCSLLKHQGVKGLKPVPSKGDKMSRIIANSWIVNTFLFKKTGSDQYNKFLHRLNTTLKTDTKADDAADAASMASAYIFVNYRHLIHQ